MKLEKTTLEKLMPWGFALYFLVLFAERVQSLLRTVLAALDGQNMFGTPFSVFVFSVASLSFVTALVLLGIFGRSLFSALAGRGPADYVALSRIAGVALLGGMVHTEFTVAPVQFVAYGALILSMAMQTLLAAREETESRAKFALWFHFAYATCFSMAIPVVYYSPVRAQIFFHAIEATVTFLLVFFFTEMLEKIFRGRGKALISFVPFLVMLVGVLVIFLMNLSYEPNIFAMIFAIITTGLYAAGLALLGKAE